MEYSLEQLRSAYDKLPENIKSVIDSVDSIDTMVELRKKHSLSIEQIGYVADETSLTMLGLTHPKDFVGNIKNKLGVDEEIAQGITKDINDKIFAPIKDSLVLLHKKPKIDTVKPAEKVESIKDSYREPLEIPPEPMPEIISVKTEKENVGVETVPSKEDLLKEIEDKASIETTVNTPKQINTDEDFIRNKLTSQTNIPSKESEEMVENPDKTVVSAGYSDGDPYKEPLS